MRRGDFLTLAAVATGSWPLAARAQQAALPVIGFVNSASLGPYPPVSAFLNGLGEAGFIEGRDVVIEYRWAEGEYERLPALLANLVQREVSVSTATSTPAALAAKAATTSIPVIFTTSGDPVGLGLVSGLNKPGGNLTGITQVNVEVAPKRLELMHEVLPTATSFALLVNPPDPLAEPVIQALSVASASLELKLNVVHAGNERDLATIFDSLVQLKTEALATGSDAFFSNRGELLGRLALRHRLPAIYRYPEFTAAGGLLSYSGNVAESYRLAGIYAGRILKGEKPANLAVQEVTKVELIINLKTAKVLGITVPLPLSGRADEVIE